MSLTTPKYKKPAGTPDNSVYLLALRSGLFCEFCRHPGIKRRYQNLWVYSSHLHTHHDTEEFKPTVAIIANLIKRGIIK